MPNSRFASTGTKLTPAGRDPKWKDPQIYSPKPEPSSGGRITRYRIDSRQKLLRLEYAIDPARCLLGKNRVEIRRVADSAGGTSVKVDLEKLEVRVCYA